MINVNEILEEAHGYFTNQEYDIAIFLYSQVLSLEPNNIEYKIYPVLCDIGSENSDKAQALFEYFSIQKELDETHALESIKEAISAYDGNNEQMMKIFRDFSIQTIESLDAIDYEDFLNLVDSRGSFREAYEDIMFSTKVAIKSKKDLIDFIEQLIDNDFSTTAYSYLDNFQKLFTFDDEISKLYEKLGGKALENSQK
jgi:tetratricopeptide (TPR) repeat protein